MGKYPTSEIHDKYSAWHYGLIKVDNKYQRLALTDIDRMWLEYDYYKNAVVALFDLKWDESCDSTLTPTEKGIYDWFISKGCPVFIVFISRDFDKFTVVNGGIKLVMNQDQYANWLLDLRNQIKM